MTPCNCELRNRAQDPNTGRCRSCGQNYKDERRGNVSTELEDERLDDYAARLENSATEDDYADAAYHLLTDARAMLAECLRWRALGESPEAVQEALVEWKGISKHERADAVQEAGMRDAMQAERDRLRDALQALRTEHLREVLRLRGQLRERYQEWADRVNGELVTESDRLRALIRDADSYVSSDVESYCSRDVVKAWKEVVGEVTDDRSDDTPAEDVTKWLAEQTSLGPLVADAMRALIAESETHAACGEKWGRDLMAMAKQRNDATAECDRLREIVEDAADAVRQDLHYTTDEGNCPKTFRRGVRGTFSWLLSEVRKWHSDFAEDFDGDGWPKGFPPDEDVYR